MWVLLAIVGAALAAYGFLVWRYDRQRRQTSATTTRKTRRAF
jgi:Flp pilus assembly protein TadB